MARRQSKHPTELELEILKILWDRSPMPVREVREVMASQGRDLAHTTLITTLNVMFDKRYVERRKVSGERGYAFSPKVARDQVSRGMVGDLVQRVFGGSASAMMLGLLENEHLDPEEHGELMKVIENYRRKKAK